LRVLVGAFAASKGPDAGGYTASDETIYSFVDISGASSGRDAYRNRRWTAPVTLPFDSACMARRIRSRHQHERRGTVDLAGRLHGVRGLCQHRSDSAQVPSDRSALLPF
jgi:hypothetical protein